MLPRNISESLKPGWIEVRAPVNHLDSLQQPEDRYSTGYTNHNYFYLSKESGSTRPPFSARQDIAKAGQGVSLEKRTRTDYLRPMLMPEAREKMVESWFRLFQERREVLKEHGNTYSGYFRVGQPPYMQGTSLKSVREPTRYELHCQPYNGARVFGRNRQPVLFSKASLASRYNQLPDNRRNR